MTGSLLSLFVRRYCAGIGEPRPLKGLAAWRRTVTARSDLVKEGDSPADACFLIEGFAARCKMMPEGRRTTVGLLVPGDFCGNFLELHGGFDHGIVALTDCIVASVPVAALAAAMREDEALGNGLARALLVEAAIQRQWLCGMNSAADKRVAHLLCELRTRLQLVGMAEEDSFPLPITQQDISEAAGMSAVHMNRTMQRLKELELIRTVHHVIRFPSPKKTEKFANFDPAYLMASQACRAK